MRLHHLLLPFLLTACNGSATEDSGPADTDNTSGSCDGVDPVSGTDVDVRLIASGLNMPTDIVNAGDGSGRVFVTEQGGAILAFDAEGNQTPFLDISSQVRSGGERGLLSLAFHPNYASNNKFYVHYSDTNGDTVVSEFTGTDSSTERVLITANQPAPNHNGGKIGFGPDGYLYIGLGDGGGANDTYGNGQREDTLLAKLLRIDVDDTSSGAYGIPSDNPFVGVGSHRPETWAWGLRNPWKFSWDRETDEMWIGDVGQDTWEEVDIGRAGANYGWPVEEGRGASYDQPVFTLRHDSSDDPVSIVGGYVYRGCVMPDLHGTYFFSDTPWFGNSPLWSLTWDGTTASQGPIWVDEIVGRVTTMGEDESGELYLGEYTNGQLYKLVPRQ